MFIFYTNEALLNKSLSMYEYFLHLLYVCNLKTSKTIGKMFLLIERFR